MRFFASLRFAQNDNYLKSFREGRRLAVVPPTSSPKTKLPVILSETKNLILLVGHY
jgi:hypothetical protein